MRCWRRVTVLNLQCLNFCYGKMNSASVRENWRQYNNWWETETNQIIYFVHVDCGQLNVEWRKHKREERKRPEKNSKHVFALIVFNKQHLNVNYCDYFVWCAEVNYFSLLVMWRFIYSHKNKTVSCVETWMRDR